MRDWWPLVAALVIGVVMRAYYYIRDLNEGARARFHNGHKASLNDAPTDQGPERDSR